MRLPEISGPGARLEHRICGADTNPYLAMTAVLGRILHGLDNEIDPGEALNSAGDSIGTSNPQLLHHDWATSVEEFASSDLALNIFGEDFHRVYTTLRRHEIGQLAKQVSDVELGLYLRGA